MRTIIILSFLACNMLVAQTDPNSIAQVAAPAMTTNNHMDGPIQKSAESRRVSALQILTEGKSRAFAGQLAAAAEAARILTTDSVHGERLSEAVEIGVGLIPVMDRAISDLAFRPRKEAKSPAGFPDFTPVGMIEIKSYPAYRQVQTKMSGYFEDQRAFFRLFNHIKENEISMTSPVPVERGTDGQKTMSFLYGDAQIGEPKLSGDVKVLDVKPVTVVSIGMRYRDSEKARNSAVVMLEKWLANHKDTWVAIGGWRTMGWNSPMVRGSQRYWEVQIPVRLRLAQL